MGAERSLARAELIPDQLPNTHRHHTPPIFVFAPGWGGGSRRNSLTTTFCRMHGSDIVPRFMLYRKKKTKTYQTNENLDTHTLCQVPASTPRVLFKCLGISDGVRNAPSLQTTQTFRHAISKRYSASKRHNPQIPGYGNLDTTDLGLWLLSAYALRCLVAWTPHRKTPTHGKLPGNKF